MLLPLPNQPPLGADSSSVAYDITSHMLTRSSQILHCMIYLLNDILSVHKISLSYLEVRFKDPAQAYRYSFETKSTASGH